MLGRALFCALVFLLGVAVGHYAFDAKPAAWGDGRESVGSGDVNGDRNVDLADAVYLLEHLFHGGPAPVSLSDGRKVVFLIRHGEKNGTNLSETGRMRAAHLATLFEHMKLDALIATDLVRTQQTLEPLAEAQAALGNQLEIQITDATASATVEAIRALPPGSKAVAAGHSFTVTSVIRDLGATEDRLPFPGNEHDNVWVLTLDPDGEADVVPLKYYVLPDCRDCDCPECPEDPLPAGE